MEESRMHGTRHLNQNDERGFSLIEVLMSTALATVGLLAACQLLYLAMSASSLARSKETAVVSAINKLESLSHEYSKNPSHRNVLPGSHGPEEIRVINPDDGSDLNRYRVSWTVDIVQDPRPGKILDSRRVRVTVTPVLAGGAVNYRPPFNKILNVTTVFSRRMR